MRANRPPRNLETLSTLPDEALITEQELEILTEQSVRTWQSDRMRSRPRLPYLKLSRSVRYAIGDVRRHLASCRVGYRAA